jgi:hypothetical protein
MVRGRERVQSEKAAGKQDAGVLLWGRVLLSGIAEG